MSNVTSNANTTTTTTSKASERPHREPYLYYHDGKWNNDFAPTEGEAIKVIVRKPFSDIALYYANVIDYGRCLLAVAALIMIMHAPEYLVTISAMLMANTLLDWVDGPVARAYKQSTVMGCGWDWLADILNQYAAAVWVTALPFIPAWFRTFTVLFTVVEISTGLFDFATSSKGFYPQEQSPLPWYAVVEEWLTPSNSYNNLGIACWLINTLLPIAYALNWPSWATLTLLPFGLLYAWHEVAQFIFIVGAWVELTATRNRGIEHMRMCTEAERSFIKQEHDQLVKSPKIEAGGGVIYWNNLYINGAWLADYAKKAEMEALVNSLLREFYPRQKRYLRSCGFITSPANSKKSQAWHYDYSAGTSNLFIPLVDTTPRNATQFIRGERPEPLPVSQCFPPPNHLLSAKSENLNAVEMSQVVCKAYSILKMFPCVMHRGIQNGENHDRVLFFVSSDDVPISLEEDQKVLVQEDFHNNTADIHEGDTVDGVQY